MYNAFMASVILHNVRSVYNTASIFRTADGAGVEKVYLSGYTPAPVDRFGRVRKNFHKVALGAEESVEWESVEDFTKLVEWLHAEGRQVVAVEQTPDAVGYREFKAKDNAVFVFGNEVNGLPEEVTNICDGVVEIPMHGEKQSLNVSVSAGVILFHAA